MIKRCLSLAALTLALNGCASWFGKESWLQDEKSYMAERLEKPLALPADMSRATVEDEYRVPAVASAASEAGEARPPRLVLSLGRDVLVDNAGRVPVVTFNMPRAAVMERVEAFLSAREIPVATRDPASGVIITDWVETEESGFFDMFIPGADTKASREKFKLTVREDGASGKGALVVEQVAVERNEGDGWSSEAPSRAGNIDMLNRYLAWHDEREQRAARARVLAEKAGFELRLGKNSSDVPALLAPAAFQRVWERVPAALEPLGFVIEDRDQSLGTYFVKYDGPPSGGFLSGLKFWKDKSEVDALDLAEDDYQLKLEDQGDMTAILVLDDDGKPLAAESLQKILPPLSSAFQTRNP